MTIEKLRLKIIFIIFFIFCSLATYAENLTDYDFNYSIDIPEGYIMENFSENGMSYFLSHPNIPVKLVIKINTTDNSSSKETLKTNLEKLNAKSSVDTFDWNGKTAAISNFTMSLDNKYSGWAISSELTVENSYITMICYCPVEKEQYCQQFIMSTLNSLCVDFNLYNTPGIIVSYAYPKEGSKNISLNINNTQIKTSIDKVDEAASQFLIEMEYGVLVLYAKHDLWKEAWQRYYRMIYRDSFSRLEKVSKDIYTALYPNAKKDSTNTDIKYAQFLLSWVQSFDYKRGSKTDSDFTSLIAAICGQGNDCDSRSLLICVLLKQIGIESILLISHDYQHAMVATEIEAPGQVYTLDGTDRYFIYGETTAKVTWGMIFKDFEDSSKWIPVILP